MIHFPDKKLSLKDVGKIRFLLKDLAKNWHVLGIALGFSKDTLDQITSTPADSTVLLNRMLGKWLAGDVDSPTVSVLVNALGGIEGTDEVIESIITGTFA